MISSASFKDPPTSNQPSHTTPGNAHKPLSSAHSHTITTRKDQLAALPLPLSPQTPWRLPYRPQLSARVSQRMRLVSQRRRRRPWSPLPARLERIHSSKWCDRCLRAARSLLNQRGGGEGAVRTSPTCVSSRLVLACVGSRKCPPWLPLRERLFSVVPSTYLAAGKDAASRVDDLISPPPG